MKLRNILLSLLVLSGITLYLLTVATGNTNKLSENFGLILGLNVLIIVSLFFVLGKQFYKLFSDIQNNVYGAKLTASMLKRFTLVAVLPGLFLFAVSAQFIGHSINSWFGNDTREALDRSLNLSKVALNNFLNRVIQDARLTGLKVKYGITVDQPLNDIFAGISTDLSKFEQVAVMDVNDGHLIMTSSNPNKLPWPAIDQLDWPLISNNPIVSGNSLVNNKLYSQVYLHIYPRENEEYIIFFRKKVPEAISSDVMLIENANSKYAELTYNKKGLQTFFILTLFVATLLSILISLLAAIFFARRFVEPLIALSKSTKAVSLGDFTKRNPIFRDDELGQLSERFNYMIERLQAEQDKSQTLYEEQQTARRYFEGILFNLTSGVLTLDFQGYIKTYNASVENILNFSLIPYLNEKWTDWSHEDVHIGFLKIFIEKLLAQKNSKPLEFEYSANDSIQILLGRITILEDNEGLVMVFDDVTKLVTAQKEAAWGEVARRLAHEIKNPLTPIQLSAERVQFKLEDKLDEKDAEILKKSTQTIIHQVAALKEMVESFRNYARAVVLNLVKIDFNELTRDVLTLYEGVDCKIIANLTAEELPVKVDATALRQVLHNIFKNGYEAAKEDPEPELIIETKKDNSAVVLVVLNNGKGFSQEMIQHAFEPYVTDKNNGTGLGLAVVKKIIEEHDGSVVLQNRTDKLGALVKITLNLVSE